MTAQRRMKTWLKRRAAVVGSVVATTSPAVVLTYDDGPDPVDTPRILDELSAHGASATFFVLLTRTRRFPELLQHIVECGHEVGLHGPDHRPLTDFSHGEAVRRTRAARCELEDQLGREVVWFRPPYGAQSPSTWRAVRKAGLTPVLWSASTWDWKDISQDERVSRTLRDGRPGSVILAHDAFAGVEDGARPAVAPHVDRADLARRVLDGFADRGERVTGLSAALHAASAVREASFSRTVAEG